MTSLKTASTWTDRDAVTGEYALKVLAYTDCIKRTVEKAKEPGFDETGWDELAAMLDTAKFRRVGNDKVDMGWDVYRKLLMMWATTTDFRAEFHRISEVGDRVFLELTEHNHPRGGTETVVNSCTVYQFDEAGKLVHLDIYLQHD
ncbi:MAG: nuclear transport factor 2 family protein [Novosphingobium sp.]|nr:nuclear transport factor 2 family protein [Novosphingobium sp.]